MVLSPGNEALATDPVTYHQIVHPISGKTRPNYNPSGVPESRGYPSRAILGCVVADGRPSVVLPMKDRFRVSRTSEAGELW
jgi:hypothetical protein